MMIVVQAPGPAHGELNVRCHMRRPDAGDRRRAPRIVYYVPDAICGDPTQEWYKCPCSGSSASKRVVVECMFAPRPGDKR